MFSRSFIDTIVQKEMNDGNSTDFYDFELSIEHICIKPTYLCVSGLRLRLKWMPSSYIVTCSIF